MRTSNVYIDFFEKNRIVGTLLHFLNAFIVIAYTKEKYEQKQISETI